MRIVFLTPGTGSYHCGACMRDNALARALQGAGCDVSLLPMYLPLRLDDEPFGGAAPVFFGGINVMLQHRWALFRRTPRWLDRWLDRPWLLRGAARHGHLTSARGHGAMTLAMLRVEQGPLGKELDRLAGWLAGEAPDVVCLSTVLLAGMIRELKRRLGGVKVVACFQGEDSFLDGLPEPFRGACWRELAERVGEADALVAPSRYYAGLMGGRLGPGVPAIEVIPNGVDLEVYQPGPAPGGPPVIGFLARMTRDKGVDVAVDAFIHLRTVLGERRARLCVAGAMTAGDRRLVGALRRRLARVGLAGESEWLPDIDRAAKLAVLRSLSLFSVPAVYHEAFGLYLAEALACGVPVVQPAAASFPELVGGAGVLVAPGDAAALARAWHGLLGDPGRLGALRVAARRAAEERFGMAVARDGYLALARRVCGGAG